MQIQWPPGLDNATFLREYWQRKPLLVRQAFPDFDNPLSPDELAGLACEEDIPSRLITEHSDSRWAVEHGPFSEERLSSLPTGGWSLLVTDIEKHLPEFIAYVQAFRFIPDWRIDDLMISYAPTGASVGAHTDQYDVFLLQTSGHREWQIGDTPLENPELIPALDLKILRHFTPAQILTLGPGDMLYLPPGIAHHGISLDNDCMTWSFGFRAPSLGAMIVDYARFLADTMDKDPLYRDPGLLPQDNPGEITRHAQKDLFAMFKDKFVTDERLFGRWVGRFLTETATPWYADTASDDASSDLLAELQDGQPLSRSTEARLAYITGDDHCRLYANGQSFSCSHELVQTLCAAYRYSADKLLALYQDSDNRSLLDTLYTQQVLYVDALAPGHPHQPMTALPLTLAIAHWPVDGPALLQLREEVFVVEQGVPPDLEVDGEDPTCLHLKATANDGTLIGTGRLMPTGRISRLAVRHSARGHGVGAALLQAIVKAGRARGHVDIYLHAQCTAIPFYERFGFVPEGDLFEDAGIDHQTLRLPPGSECTQV